MVLDAALLNTHYHKVHIKGIVEQSRKRSGDFPLHLSVIAIKKVTFWSPSTTVTNSLYLHLHTVGFTSFSPDIYIYIYRVFQKLVDSM